MAVNKPTRPRAGLGLSSAINAEQLKTRSASKVASAKPAKVESSKARPRDADRRTPPKR